MTKRKRNVHNNNSQTKANLSKPLPNQKLKNLNQSPIDKIKSEKTIILDFAKRPWVIITTIILTLTGGIPGLILTYNYFNERPKLNIEVYTTEFGNIGKGYVTTYWLFSCGITNVGEKPLFPDVFNAKIIANGKEYQLSPQVIPKHLDSALRTNPSSLAEYDSLTQKQLQSTKKISKDESVFGFLYFTSPDSIEKFYQKDKNSYIIIECLDIFKRKYQSEHILNIGEIKKGTYYPKTGVRFIRPS